MKVHFKYEELVGSLIFRHFIWHVSMSQHYFVLIWLTYLFVSFEVPRVQAPQ